MLTPNASRAQRSWLYPAAVSLLAFAVFSPALRAGFLNWDDDKILLDNPLYRGLDWTHLRWMFTTTFSGQYQPLSWMTLGLDFNLWGLDPAGYHLSNLLLHAAGACVFYFLAKALLEAGLRETGPNVEMAAAFSALFFALHPLRVESVAWATERRDVLSGFFYLASVLLYVKAPSGEGRSRALALSVLCFAGGLLSKAIALGLPLALLLLDVYPLRRIDPLRGSSKALRSALIEKWPYAALAVAAAAPLWLAQKDSGAIQAAAAYGPVAGGVRALYAMAFYLGKNAAPWPLLPLYEAPDPDTPFAARFLLGAAASLAVTAGLLWKRREWPAALAAWLAQGLLMAPALGFVKFGPQVVAARYTYFACGGWALVAGALWHRWHAARSRAALAGGLTALALLAALSWRLTLHWRDSLSLWTYEIAHAPATALAQNDLAEALADAGDARQAVLHYREALRVKPDYPEAAYNLANAYLGLGELDDAREAYGNALRLQPRFPRAWNNLGNLLQQQRDFAGAINCYQEALRLQPDYADAYVNMGNALVMEGKPKDAVEDYRIALRLQPSLDAARKNLDFVEGVLRRAP